MAVTREISARRGWPCHETAAWGYGSPPSRGRRGGSNAYLQSPRHALRFRRRRRIGRFQRLEFARQHVAQHLHMRDDVGAGDEAEVELVAVALHRDVEG